MHTLAHFPFYEEIQTKKINYDYLHCTHSEKIRKILSKTSLHIPILYSKQKKNQSKPEGMFQWWHLVVL